MRQLTGLSFVLAILLFCSSGPAQGGEVDAAKTAAEFAQKLKPQIPEGWTVAANKNIVTVSRQKPVEWYGTISLPAHNDKAELKAQGFVHSSPYTITVEFGPPLTPDAVAKLEEPNKRTMEDYYRQHPVDPHAKPTSPPKEVTDKLHHIPNVLTKDYSALVIPSIQGSLAFYSPEDEVECQRVEQRIKASLK